MLQVPEKWETGRQQYGKLAFQGHVVKTIESHYLMQYIHVQVIKNTVIKN